jgi:hypothetical protein
VSPGDYLYRAGVASYDYYAVATGAVEIVDSSAGVEHVIVRHGPGGLSASSIL